MGVRGLESGTGISAVAIEILFIPLRRRPGPARRLRRRRWCSAALLCPSKA